VTPFWGVALGVAGAKESVCLVVPWMVNGTLEEYLKKPSIHGHSDLPVILSTLVRIITILTLSFAVVDSLFLGFGVIARHGVSSPPLLPGDTRRSESCASFYNVLTCITQIDCAGKRVGR
jgi:hypothetical protein